MDLALSRVELRDLTRISAPTFDEYPYAGWARADRVRRLDGGRSQSSDLDGL